MRPVRLKLQAFGPFAGEEVIDFREAVAAGLFGIYGQTGSGKSTIFSALTFALFGEATKADQETPTLRSDHADLKTLTEVEFIFEVGHRQYVVVRRPEQTRPKQRGTGETTAPHEAYLFDATGLSLEEISAGNRGKVLAEKKTGVVDEAIVDILGYGAKQFRQIVLLPQGKFEMFLAAKTDDRLAILRDLFDVSIYRQLAAKFKDSAADAEREVAQERDVCARRLKAAGFESSDALEVGIATAAGEHGLAIEAEGKAYQAVEGVRAELDEGRRIDGLFVAAETAAAALVERLGREEEFRELGERVVVARRVKGLADVERHAVEAAAGATGFEERLREAREASTAAVAAAGVAKSALEELKGKAHEIDAFRQKSEALERHRQALAAAAGLGKEATYQAGLLGKAKKAFEDAEWRHGELAKQKVALGLSLKTAREKAASRAALDLRRAGLKSALKDAERFEQAKDKCAKAQLKRAREAATFKEKAEATDEAKGKFDQAEAELSAVQALHLAAKLKDGEACPVCGSHEHPALATGAIENRGLDQVFREARKAWEAARDEREKASAAFASATGVADAVERDFAELGEPAQPSAALREAVTGVEKDLVNLGEPVDLEAIEREVAKLGEDVAEAETVRETARVDHANAAQDEALARDRYGIALATIPAEYRTPAAIEAAVKATDAEIVARQNAMAVAETAERTASEKVIGAAKDVDGAQSALNQAIERRDVARDEFAGRLAGEGLTEERYEACKAWVATIDANAEAVEAHKQALGIALKNDEGARTAIEGQVRPDLAPLGEALAGLEKVARAAIEKKSDINARLDQLKDLRNEIAESLSAVQELEARTGALRELARLFNAENGLRLNLETYAIGAMFEYVLGAANRRLGPMTNGRYKLERDTEKTGGRARQGLGIAVFDSYTGKKRPPSTLSGGETFIAALSLALGLSDVVESVNGKIHLDAIFIDEGFGSLDTENESGTLDQVLQVLTQLVSQRRAVGVISHVPQVQDVIPNGFYVRKEPRGSRIEARTEAA